MDESKALDILKKAYLMEQQGKMLYETAARQAENDDVKSFFKELAMEEQLHMDILEKQSAAIKNEGRFADQGFEKDLSSGTPGTSGGIFDKSLVQGINSAGFEATAITAAVSLEENAVKFYTRMEKDATEPDAKKMYNWLANWEKTHLKNLTALQEELTERIWGDNSFWPF